MLVSDEKTEKRALIALANRVLDDPTIWPTDKGLIVSVIVRILEDRLNKVLPGVN